MARWPILRSVDVKYTVGTVAELSGLSQHTIRAWERRYGAVSPSRSVTNRRLFDDADLLRFRLLKVLVERGHSIGQVAALPTDELEALASLPPAPQRSGSEPSTLLAEARRALERLDAGSLEDVLVSATAHLGLFGLIEQVVLPLLSEVDSGWSHGTLSIYQEHFATAVLRTHLDRVRQSLKPSASAPTLVVTTPARQMHELGALLVGLVASLQDWHVVYLGPNLPAEEIAVAAGRTRCQAIGLSIVYPSHDPDLPPELRMLRSRVGSSMPIFAGGNAVASYGDVLHEIGAIVVPGFAEFQTELQRLARALRVP